MIYLPGHNRSTHEVLFGNDKDIAGDYNSSFVGMPETECPLATLLETRLGLRNELPARLTKSHRNFLAGLAHSEPGSSLLQYPHANELPALRWKVANLEIFRDRRPKDFEAQARTLKQRLSVYDETQL